ncbi:MAG TPA: hypothetical protein VJG83_06985 [archaeon]|nr:hypothetical protein [archaeon]
MPFRPNSQYNHRTKLLPGSSVIQRLLNEKLGKKDEGALHSFRLVTPRGVQYFEYERRKSGYTVYFIKTSDRMVSAKKFKHEKANESFDLHVARQIHTQLKSVPTTAVNGSLHEITIALPKTGSVKGLNAKLTFEKVGPEEFVEIKRQVGSH